MNKQTDSLLIFVFSLLIGFILVLSIYLNGLDGSFFGSFLGAVLTGGTAIGVYIAQFRKEEEHRKQNYYKTFKMIKKKLALSKDFIMQMNEIVIKQSNDDKELVKNLFVWFKGLQETMEAIQKEDVPYEIFNSFDELKDNLQTINLCLEVYIKAEKLTILLNELEESNKEALRCIGNIETYFENNI